VAPSASPMFAACKDAEIRGADIVPSPRTTLVIRVIATPNRWNIWGRGRGRDNCRHVGTSMQESCARARSVMRDSMIDRRNTGAPARAGITLS